jgi:LCP family protein required for cell wall assembly
VRIRLSTIVLGLLLGVGMLALPSPSVKPAQMMLVQVERASTVDTDPDVIWILAVGSDARPGEDMTRTRGDALQLIGMNTKTGAAAAIGIPRDSYVNIPGYGSNRVNAALYYGGPQLLGETIGDMVGIYPEYVFVTQFKLFQAMVDSIGPIYVHNPVAFSDTYLKPNGFETGRIKLSGYTALAFSRSRHGLINGDFDRSANQQRVIIGIQEKIREKAKTRGWLERGVLTAMANMDTGGASPAVLYRLAHAAASLRSSKFTTCVVQGGYATIGGASVVTPYLDQARAYGDDARNDAVLDGC